MRSPRWFAAAAIAAVLPITACGGDDNNASKGLASAAEKPAVAPPPTKPPTEIQVAEKLPRTPPAGKEVVFLQCELPACERYVPGVKSAAETLGWSAQVRVFKNAAPGAGLQQAINQRPDYIAMTGIPAAAITRELKAAAEAEIPVISCATTDKPAPGGYAVQCGGTLETDADYLGRWMINDSGGEADVVAVTIPQFPVLNTETDWFESNLERKCPGCSYDQLDVTVDDVAGGAVPQKLVAYLQSHPDVEYVYFTFNDLTRGVPVALRTAGLDERVKLVGAAGDASIMEEIGSTQAAWTIAPNVYSAWVMFDAMARLSVGESLGESYTSKVYTSPTWVVDSAESAKLLEPTGYDWFGPEGFEDQFKSLWQAGT